VMMSRSREGTEQQIDASVQRLELFATGSVADERKRRAAALAPEDPQVWLDLQSLYERSQMLDLSWEARARAEALAGGRPISQDELGLYQIEGSSWLP